MRRPVPTRATERGLVLVVSLVFLLALTLLGLAAMQNTSLEERMAGNVRAENLAMQSAETALRAGECWLIRASASPDVCDQAQPQRIARPTAKTTAPNPGNNEVWAVDGPNPDANSAEPWWTEATPAWWTGGSNSIEYWTDLAGVPRPRYLVEEAGLVRDSLVLGTPEVTQSGRWFYQVTSRATDAGGRGEVLLRSTFARRF